MKKFKNTAGAVLLFSVLMYSCKTWNHAQNGTVIGAAGGAAAGAVIGTVAGNTALGAIIGAAAGGATGAIIGHKMDKQAEEIKKDLPDAKVERVGEGIVVEFSDKVLFDINQYNLSNESKTTLNKLVDILIKYPDTNIEIQGHTDNTGTEAYNQLLSERRATAVSNYLAGQSISSARLTTKGFGEADPKYSNDTEEGRSQNRNVQFLIYANEKMKQDAKKEAGQ